MSELEGAVYLIALFVLRCLVPLGVLMGAGYVLRRLDEKWQREAAAGSRRVPAGIGWLPSRPSPRPVAEPMALAQPCWQLKGCDPLRRESCPAFLQPETPCWLAHLQAGYGLLANCPSCALFTQYVGRD